MSRHLLVLKLDSSSGTIKLNFPNDDAGHLRIRSFQVIGVTATSWMFINFNNIATLPISAGTNNPNTIIVNSGAYPLPIVVQPNNISTWDFHIPLEVMGGDNLMTLNQLIEYQITDSSGNPYPSFTSMTMILDFIPRSQFNNIAGDRMISNTLKTNKTERHENFSVITGFDHQHERFY